MASAMTLALLLLCLLVTHTYGSRRVLLHSTYASAGASTSSSNACPSIASGHSNDNKLPVMHRLSPCSPRGRGSTRMHGKAALDEILNRDGLRMRYLSEVQEPAAAAATTASSATPASSLTVPAATQKVTTNLPGVFTYTVLAGYGTPAQQFPVYFDVSGMSNLRCKPCVSGSGPAGAAAPCDRAFDPSRSSSLRGVPCGSPACAAEPLTSCSSAGSSCAFAFANSTFVYASGTVVTDTLTLSPSATFEDFFVGCMNVDNFFFDDGVAVGNIDLSRRRHSLATRALLSSPPGTAAFSYCLPVDTDTHGFLTVDPPMSDYSDLAGVKYLPLVDNPTGPDLYYVDLVGVAVDGKDLPFAPTAFTTRHCVITECAKHSANRAKHSVN